MHLTGVFKQKHTYDKVTDGLVDAKVVTEALRN